MDYNEDTVVDDIQAVLDQITEDLKVKSNKFQEDKTHYVESLKAVSKTINKKGGIVTFNWCGDTECGKQIEEEFNIDILGTQPQVEVEGECIHCGKEAKHRALVSKTY